MRTPLVVALAAFGAAVAVAVLVIATSGQPANEADVIARQLRCPDCQGLSVADSPTGSAAEIRRQIDAMLASGEEPAGVREHFVARYGEWILLAPAASAWWVLPLAVVGVAVAGLATWLARAGRGAPRDRAAPVDDALRRRVHDDAEAMDA